MFAEFVGGLPPWVPAAAAAVLLLTVLLLPPLVVSPSLEVLVTGPVQMLLLLEWGCAVQAVAQHVVAVPQPALRRAAAAAAVAVADLAVVAALPTPPPGDVRGAAAAAPAVVRLMIARRCARLRSWRQRGCRRGSRLESEASYVLSSAPEIPAACCA